MKSQLIGCLVLLTAAIVGDGYRETPSAPTPHPREWVSITQGAPLVVPQGRVFVPTAVGHPSAVSNGCGLRINGQLEAWISSQITWGGSMFPVPAGRVAGPGSIVEPFNPYSSQTGQVCWGYLVDPSAVVQNVDMAAPRYWVSIKSAVPYSVPQGKLFVLTSAGTVDSNGYGFVKVNGNTRFQTTSTGMQSVPMGAVFGSGSQITVESQSSTDGGRAWGYLVDA